MSESDDVSAPAARGKRNGLRVAIAVGAVLLVVIGLGVWALAFRSTPKDSPSYKVGYSIGQDMPGSPGLFPLGSPAEVGSSCEKSLENLRKATLVDRDAAIESAARSVKIRDLKTGPFLDGCRAGVLSTLGE
jgi:hypothetical protein